MATMSSITTALACAPSRASRKSQRRAPFAFVQSKLRASNPAKGSACLLLPRHRTGVQFITRSGDMDLPPMPELDFDDDEETDPLDNWNLLRILHSEMPDQQVNELVWECLGYRKDESGEWQPTECFPKWAERYPKAPDVIGVTRIYTKEVDGECMKANQALVRSIPQFAKQNLKATMKPYGWKGFSMDGLTPNMTRRAQVVNWLIYYRDHLRGKSVEQLVAEREARAAAQEQSVREKPIV
mmetsp:Transcript_41570/g.77913  ORF Transcript_41570/g.77913 Transcript_41570/m.77913 type:complete len:241 (-) Transcript_41570:512-1234(-)|eukprot:CAMPEP_0114285390 /NCGR_PEP_ID=MMETSP0059-20121206/5153_1 /TAXON_ID=36894 /ORGANISM="Pyramimonas parkeae, Strain CCMP726" /LENGTH=240 /DNA_ID=CAMNT_0001406269 /DNA_START=26 /DNA_END=748 /DNA_ORIENTATION=-